MLATLIIMAAVANLPLAKPNVALPSIGAAFDTSQTQLNLVAVVYSLGLACSVLWFCALGDRYGRIQIVILGVALAIPANLICGFARSIQVLIIGLFFGGFAAGEAAPDASGDQAKTGQSAWRLVDWATCNNRSLSGAATTHIGTV